MKIHLTTAVLLCAGLAFGAEPRLAVHVARDVPGMVPAGKNPKTYNQEMSDKVFGKVKGGCMCPVGGDCTCENGGCSCGGNCTCGSCPGRITGQEQNTIEADVRGNFLVVTECGANGCTRHRLRLNRPVKMRRAAPRRMPIRMAMGGGC